MITRCLYHNMCVTDSGHFGMGHNVGLKIIVSTVHSLCRHKSYMTLSNLKVGHKYTLGTHINVLLELCIQ